MKKLALHFIIPVILLGIAEKTVAQNIDSVMTIYEEQSPKEKIHIHFDRTIYNKEETIFYKLYLMTNSDLSPLSKNVYVAWYDTSGNFIRQTAAPLYQSSAKGSFDIPFNYKGSFIRVKAFTRWMLNDDSIFIYQKDIPINSGILSKTKSSVAKTKVELFPESGVLVQGLNSRVAFKATNNFGMPVFIKGFLVNDKSKIVDTIKVAHDGMGVLNFKIIPGENYQLNWTDENGQKSTTQVPQGLKSGVTLKVTMDNEKAFAQVERTAEVPDNYKYLRLLVHQNQHLIYTVEFKGEDRLTQKASLPIDELPTGVLQLSLFTKDWVPIAERIVFVNNRLHEYNAKLSIPLTNLLKRGKNVIEILVSDTAASNMSIAVTDASIVMPEQQNIYSDFLLSSEIRGKVYQPAYYFSSDADSIAAHLDLVMLTNGWRKFDWEKVKAGILPVNKFPFETDFMKITGKVYGSLVNKIPPDLQLNLVISSKDSSKKFLNMSVMKDGSFEEKNIFFFDTARVFYGFNGNARLTDQVQVQIQNGLLHQEFRKINLGINNYLQGWSDSMARAKLNFYLLEQEKLKKQMESATLQEVVVKSKVKSPLQILESKYTSGLFSGGDGYSFDLSDDASSMGAQDVLSYLQGKVAGLMISGSGTQTSLSWRGGTPDLFMNEMKMAIDQVQNIPVSNIAYIKVFRPPFFGSMGGGAGGAIAIYTKRGKSTTRNPDNVKGMENTILGGYSIFKEFYNPNYDKPTANFDADIRTTLYWNPYVLTNRRSPRVKIEFYNNDSSKKLQVVLEGVNSNGKLARVVKYIE